MQHNCLSERSVSFFSLIHIYVGVIHTVGLSTLKPKSPFKRPVLYLYVCRLSSVSPGCCFWLLTVLPLLFSPFQLAGPRVKMVKITVESGCPWCKKGKRKLCVRQTLPPRHFDGGWWLLISNLQHSFASKPFPFFSVLSF